MPRLSSIRLALRLLAFVVVAALLASFVAGLTLPGAHEDRSGCYWTTALLPYVDCAPEVPHREIWAHAYNLWLLAPFGWMWIAALVRSPLRVLSEAPAGVAVVLLIYASVGVLIGDLWRAVRSRLT